MNSKIEKPSDTLKEIDIPEGGVAQMDGPFILSCSPRSGQSDLATLFRVTGIDIHADQFVAVSTVDPSNVQRFEYADRSEDEDEDGTVNVTFRSGQEAFRYASACGFRMATA
ncbi:hypothetical protein ACQZ6H_10660 [Agrobacterium fabrum]|uniref:hypothetical protein n=1 Tax=Agrobacterium fabrum TaxID=1176649 RepID=UPI001573C46E|nr:hypothetical protein [Agrobacterium fabrum]WIE26431.1 hypothetical protein G6L42_008390 [Agrobacterium fabrum]WIE42388.1 hypothetical protein G6L76_008390 [Agrobacterium fabrum]